MDKIWNKKKNIMENFKEYKKVICIFYNIICFIYK